jgi:hypothetical protein
LSDRSKLPFFPFKGLVVLFCAAYRVTDGGATTGKHDAMLAQG